MQAGHMVDSLLRGWSQGRRAAARSDILPASTWKTSVIRAVAARQAAIAAAASPPSVAETLGDIAADVEARVLHRRVQAGTEATRGHSALHRLADAPVLAVHDVPEIDDVLRIERRLRDLVLVEQKIVDDARRTGRERIQREGRHVLGRKAEPEVRVYE